MFDERGALRARAAMLGVVLVFGFAADGRGAAAELRAAMSCEPATGPGRVLCNVEVRAPQGSELAWADVLVVAAPDFARPLRSRTAFDVTGRGPARLSLAFVAAEKGSGEVRVRARAVVCSGGARRCRPATREVAAALLVGS